MSVSLLLQTSMHLPRELIDRTKSARACSTWPPTGSRFGLDPNRSALFVQSAVPAIDQITVDLAMLIPFNRVMRNPTLKQEIREKNLGDSYPFGFPLYAVGQAADILAFRPEVVPVGRDQVPHLELTREVARRYNQVYRGVDPHSDDSDQIAQGGLFPVIEPILGRVEKLVGTGPPGPDGNLLKMSKSLNNAIFLSDDADTVRRKVMSMFTDPSRARATDPGRVEGNPLWVFHETFNPNRAWVDEHEDLYRRGMVGDAAVKRRLVEVLDALLGPIRQRRASFEARPDDVINALREGTYHANLVAEETLAAVKRDLRRDIFTPVAAVATV